MSKKSFVLDTPIMVNGKEVKELSYDASKITASQFVLAATASVVNGQTKAAMKMRENDYSLHFYLGCYAIIAVNPDIDISDLERLSGYDVLDVADIGLLFTLRRLGEASEESTSDVPSENIPATST